MSMRKSLLIIVGIFFLCLLVGCNTKNDSNIVLRRPTGLACSIPTYDDGAVIRWNAVEGASEYRVFINNKEIGITNSNWYYFSYEESDVYCGKTCTIQAQNTSGGISLISSGLIIPDKAPIDIQKINFYFTVTTKIDNSMLIEWQDVKADKYEIYIDGEKIYETIDELSYLLSSDLVFKYNGKILSVRVIENVENIEFVPVEYHIVAPVIVGTPYIKCSNDKDGNFVIKWNEVIGAESYNVYVNGSQYVTGITNLEYVFTNSPDFTGGEVTVTAVDEYGRSSAFSNSCLYSVVINSPKITGQKDQDGNLVISWNNVLHAEKYLVYYNNPLVSSEYSIEETENTSYVISKEKVLRDSDMFEVFVVAVDANDNRSEKSNIYKWSIYLEQPEITVVVKMAINTSVFWSEVENAEHYEVYVDNELYTIVKGKYCEISNSVLSKYDNKSIIIVAVSKQGVKSLPSEEYLIK